MGKKTEIRKEKPKVTYSMAVVMAFLAAEFCTLKVAPVVCFCNDLTHVFILSSSAPTHFMILSGIIDPFIFIT